MSSRVYIRKVQTTDKEELLALTRCSRDLHEPWISPPVDASSFRSYLARTQSQDHEGFVLCLQETSIIIGVVNINNIVRGSFRNASLGYYVNSAYRKKGFMQEGLILVTQFAFTNLGLHRLEANIQPNNLNSIELVKRCGFKKEGISKDFLFIDGAWKDHERWAITDCRKTLA
tara:strand:+ start:524 stop:1042 length:519 start_codon:yes stop_codon:yes gene_type:complete